MSLHRFLRRTGQANVGNKLYMNPNRTAGKPIRMSLYSLTRVGGGGGGGGKGVWDVEREATLSKDDVARWECQFYTI